MTASQPKRALILAGGGFKVAFQAGVLQVWLDEGGVSFDHADGASSGALNLAMYCQGMSGTQIADNWRKFRPLDGVDLNPPFTTSLLKYDRVRRNVFTRWGLDFKRIRTSALNARFNLYNFSRHELCTVAPQQMSEDHLIACIALPMWYPPVTIDGDVYIDAVYLTDANIESAICAGADEIWVIWTVSQRGEWHDNLINQFFQIIEMSAYGRYKQIIERIHENNARIGAGQSGEFGRRIRLRILQKEVPIHYLVSLSGDRIKEGVELGVAEARAWWAAQPDLAPLGKPALPQRKGSAVCGSMTLRGYIALGETEPATGFREGRRAGSAFEARLKLIIDDIERFIGDPDHRAAVTGTIECPKLGGRLEIGAGTLRFFPDDGPQQPKELRYTLSLSDQTGQSLTLFATQRLRKGPGADIWYDTTRSAVTIVAGTSPDVSANRIVAAGMLRISLRDFLLSLLRLRSSAGRDGRSRGAISRFVRFFLRKLWDSYFHHLQSPGPF